MNTYLTLPRDVFPDRYQFTDPLFLASKNLSRLLYISDEIDLEAPVYAVESWGSNMLLELATPALASPISVSGEEAWTAQIPLHLRYLPPSYNTSGLSTVEIPEPVVFWTCPSSDPEFNFGDNPFDRRFLGYDALFPEDTMFYHLDPGVDRKTAEFVGREDLGRLVKEIRMPVLDLDQAWFVEWGTAGMVLIGFAWVVWCLSRVWMESVYEGREDEKAETKVKKRQ